jgi:hypothetical protein
MKYIALWIVLICIFFFVLQILFPGFTESFVLNSEALEGEPWRFLTAVFLHGSLTHLVYNLFALVLFGLILESVIKSRNFFIVFIVSGVTANLVSVFFYESSLGASGAIYGILGTLTVLRPRIVVWAFGFPMPMFIASFFWILGGIYGALIGVGNTGHIAHLSGIGIGFFLGFLLSPYFLRKPGKRKKAYIHEKNLLDWEDRFMRRN